jgi:hypothetical protein
MDLLTLDVFSTLVAHLDNADGDDRNPAEDAEDDSAPAGPLALAIDLSEGEAEAPSGT